MSIFTAAILAVAAADSEPTQATPEQTRVESRRSRQAAGEGGYLRRDLEKVKADWLVVAPPEFAGALDELCAHRAKAHRVAIVRTDDVAALHGKGAEGIAKLVASIKPRFLLLAGDVDRVPTFVRDSAYVTLKFPTEATLATDHLFGAAAGRFPADTADELRVMAAKTVAYETRIKPGRWQKKISFVTGQGGYGPLIDSILEKMFARVVGGSIPGGYDVEVAYAKPSSPYSVHPRQFNEHTVGLLNEGTLFFAYVGHGARTHLDNLRVGGKAVPLLQAGDEAKVDARHGLPIMVVIACSTGEYDSARGDCIGELLFKRPRGPVAFIGGTRITQPYGNAIWGDAFVAHAFDPDVKTLGEALVGARASVAKNEKTKLRMQAALLASAMQGSKGLKPMREDVILHYNLLGDPALVIRRPAGAIELETRGEPGPGRTLVVAGRSKTGPVEITFECARDAFCRPTDLVGDTIEERLARRYANANNKVILKAGVKVKDGAFETEFRLPDDLEPGTYFVKAWAPGAMGSKKIKIEEKK